MNPHPILWKCIIIDDEQHAIDTLAGYIAQVPDLDLVQTYTSPVKALAEINDHGRIDLIFMDIDMPGKIARSINCFGHGKSKWPKRGTHIDVYSLNPSGLVFKRSLLFKLSSC